MLSLMAICFLSSCSRATMARDHLHGWHHVIIPGEDSLWLKSMNRIRASPAILTVDLEINRDFFTISLEH